MAVPFAGRSAYVILASKVNDNRGADVELQAPIVDCVAIHDAGFASVCCEPLGLYICAVGIRVWSDSVQIAPRI